MKSKKIAAAVMAVMMISSLSAGMMNVSAVGVPAAASIGETAEVKNVEEADVKITVPILGEKPDYNISVLTEGAELTGDVKWKIFGMFNDPDNGYPIFDPEMTEDEVFVEMEYFAQFTLSPADGHKLSENTKVDVWGAIVETEYDSANGTLLCKAFFKPYDEAVHELKFETSEPKAGERVGSISSSDIINRSSYRDIGVIGFDIWYDEDSLVDRDSSFEAGKEYTLKITFHVGNYKSAVFADDFKLYINGKEAVQVPTPPEYQQSYVDIRTFAVKFKCEDPDAETTSDEDTTSEETTDTETTETYPIGDVSGDGRVDVTDLSKVAAHLKTIKLLTDDEQKRAEVSGNGMIDVTDLSKIGAHVKGVKKLS